MDDSSKQVTVRDDGVEVERTIEDRSTATVVVYRLKTLAPTSTVVHIEEAIPPEDRIDTLEFHPSHLPDDWTIGNGMVQFDATVPPDTTRMFVLGIDTTDDEPLGNDGPTITQPDMGATNIPESNGAVPSTPGDNTPSPADDSSSVLNLGEKTVSDGGEAASDTDSDADSKEVLDLPDPNEDDLDTAAEDSVQSPDDADDSDDIDDPSEEMGAALSSGDAADSVDIADSIDLAEPEDSSDDLGLAEADDIEESADAGPPEDAMQEPDESGDEAEHSDAAIDVETPADAGPIDTSIDEPLGDDLDVDAEPEPDLGLQDGPEMDTAPAAGGESLVGDLLTELRSGNASEDELDELRSELGVPRADEVRFRHVQSRMDDFEAYVDALEGIINTHGTASEFVDGIERQVTDINDEISAVRSEVRAVEDGLKTADGERETLADEVAELDETVATVSDDLSQLRELVETVDDRTTTIEEELREELATVREERAEELERIETEHEEAREQLEAEFEAEFDSLREDVDSFDEVRRTLLDAFGNGLEPTSDDDTEGGDQP